MANTYIPLPGYPTAAWGQTRVWKGDHIGPALYVAGGEYPTPAAFGFPGGIESVGGEFSGNAYSGNYYVRAVAPANSFSASEQRAPAFGATASNANNTNAIALKWFYTANNVEVAANTNLAAEGVRLIAYVV